MGKLFRTSAFSSSVFLLPPVLELYVYCFKSKEYLHHCWREICKPLFFNVMLLKVCGSSSFCWTVCALLAPRGLLLTMRNKGQTSLSFVVALLRILMWDGCMMLKRPFPTAHRTRRAADTHTAWVSPSCAGKCSQMEAESWLRNRIRRPAPGLRLR